ncbi:MAG TPA: GNAT family protein [Streptosporangiaceae bacterium]|jgi:RimJ/RimL family protein N-acetyltransferase
MNHRYWPLFGLSLATRELTLRPMTEADLTPLADLLPADVELDPAATRFPMGEEPISRGTVLHQGYWRSYGSWRADAWRLTFTARAGERILGLQELEGNDFPTLRTVDSASWLAREARGRGYGKQMRAAVLALAFGPLGAELAITSAWHDNHASLGVSRALGYLPNGESRLARGDRADVLLHMRLPRADWLASGLGDGVRITGFEPCRPLFGLPAPDTRSAPGTPPAPSTAPAPSTTPGSGTPPA